MLFQLQHAVWSWFIMFSVIPKTGQPGKTPINCPKTSKNPLNSARASSLRPRVAETSLKPELSRVGS